jgi:hypothetical protein
MLRSDFGCLWTIRDKEVVGVFVRFSRKDRCTRSKMLGFLVKNQQKLKCMQKILALEIAMSNQDLTVERRDRRNHTIQ